MGAFNNRVFKASLCGVILLLMAWFIRDFNLSTVHVDTEGASVKINFIFPVNQETFKDCISILPEIPESRFTCQVEWESPHRVSIRIQEKSEIKGQKIRLIITKAQTNIPYVNKSANISIQFQKTPQLVDISEVANIPTDASFIVKFNTPMKRSAINKYIESDTQFEIIPMESIDGLGKRYTDYSQWQLTPKTHLENNKKYVLSFRKGMPAQSGLLLEKDEIITLKTTSKPEIVETAPKNNARWVGLYPKIVIESGEAIKKAFIEIDHTIIEGTLVGNRRAEFLLPKVLDFATSYTLKAQVVSLHGEKSDPIELTFTTTPLDQERVWVEVILGTEQKVVVYKGRKIIKTMLCSGGTSEEPTVLGTYYAQDRGTEFFSQKYNEGATYWVRFHSAYLFHGIPRDENWRIKKDEEAKIGMPASHGCIHLLEQDAKWVYENIVPGTMIIIRE